jgi:hypothetical protein
MMKNKKQTMKMMKKREATIKNDEQIEKKTNDENERKQQWKNDEMIEKNNENNEKERKHQ